MAEATDGSRVGQIIGGKYEIVRLVSSTGGMGVVYEARHTLVKRRFAVKFLRRELVARRANLKRFHREAEAAGALESENITATMDFGIAKDRSPYIVMEFLEGETVKSLLAREGPLPVERATDLVLQACRGIQTAHAAGIVHRDLNPQNLFVCRREDGTDLLKVLDFGIAKLEGEDPFHTHTRTGTAVGTPAYMSPEQAKGEKGVGHRADVYALGAILYEMLSGRKPHLGASYNAVLHHIATQPALPLDPEANVPSELAATIERALSQDPAQRHPSVRVLGKELKPWARRQVWPAPSTRQEERPAPRRSSELSLPSVERALRTAPGRGRWMWVAGAAGVAGVLVVVAVRAWHPSEPAASGGAAFGSPHVHAVVPEGSAQPVEASEGARQDGSSELEGGRRDTSADGTASPNGSTPADGTATPNAPSSADGTTRASAPSSAAGTTTRPPAPPGPIGTPLAPRSSKRLPHEGNPY